MKPPFEDWQSLAFEPEASSLCLTKVLYSLQCIAMYLVTEGTRILG